MKVLYLQCIYMCVCVCSYMCIYIYIMYVYTTFSLVHMCAHILHIYNFLLFDSFIHFYCDFQLLPMEPFFSPSPLLLPCLLCVASWVWLVPCLSGSMGSLTGARVTHQWHHLCRQWHLWGQPSSLSCSGEGLVGSPSSTAKHWPLQFPF